MKRGWPDIECFSAAHATTEQKGKSPLAPELVYLNIASLSLSLSLTLTLSLSHSFPLSFTHTLDMAKLANFSLPPSKCVAWLRNFVSDNFLANANDARV